LLVLLAVAAAAVLALALGRGDHSGPPRTTTETKPTRRAQSLAVEVRLLPWRLDAPLSREVVLPRPGTRDLVVLGGLRSGDSSTDSVEVLDTRNGARSAGGTLLQATHDAAGAALGPRLLVIGGGTVAPSGSTQIETRGRTAEGGALAQARADAGAVTVGHAVYLVGGYSGSAMDPEVVATSDGRRYRAVVELRVPVRYPALAAVGSRIYVFGGLAADGRPTRTVQLVDVGRRVARVIGRLPVALDGAAAGVLDGTVYLAGGLTTAGPTTAVYAFEPRGASFRRAGSLRVAVANAGASVSGGRLWIVGGEGVGGRPVAAVQTIVRK
jgi:hypothetical protein